MTDSKLDLIAKLLAKAERTTPEEAEALTEHAERLMVKYGIEQAMIDERRGRLGQTQEQIVEAKRTLTGTYARDLIGLGAAVAEGLGTVRPLQSKTWEGVIVLHLVGYESDVKQAALLMDSLQVQAMIAMRKWWARERAGYSWCTETEKRRARSSFIRGFGVGAGSRIKASRLTIVEETGSGAELVLASRIDRIDESIGKTGKARKRRDADGYAFSDGSRAGSEASTGGRALAQGRRIAA